VPAHIFQTTPIKMEVLEMLKNRLEDLERAMKQAPGERDVEERAELYASAEGRPVNETDRQEARKKLGKIGPLKVWQD